MTGVYPALEGGGPFVDALLFVMSMSTTVGWGHQPVDLTQRFDGVNTDSVASTITGDFAASHNNVMAATKILLSVSVVFGVVLIGLLVGALGSSFRAFFRKRLHDSIHEAMEMNELTNMRGTAMERHPFILAMAMLVVVIILGTKVYSSSEKQCVNSAKVSQTERVECYAKDQNSPDGWQYISTVDALYMTVISISTVGFGDYAPSSFFSKWFSVFYLPIAVCFTANAIDHISHAIVTHRLQRLEDYVLGQFSGAANGAESVGGAEGLTAYDFEELQRSVNVDHTIPMTRNDFRLAMLLRLARIQSTDLDNIDKVFSQLDQDGGGYLDPEDVVHHQQDAMRNRIKRLDDLSDEMLAKEAILTEEEKKKAKKHNKEHKGADRGRDGKHKKGNVKGEGGKGGKANGGTANVAKGGRTTSAPAQEFGVADPSDLSVE